MFFLVPEGVLGVGTVVWAHTSKIRYYKGFVAYKGTKLHVDLYDGDKFVYELKDASHRVIPDVPPKAADIKRGTRVIAKFKDKPRYYSSTVLEVDASDPSEPKYHVKLDDEDETWDSLYQLRLLPKEVQVGGNLVMLPLHPILAMVRISVCGHVNILTFIGLKKTCWIKGINYCNTLHLRSDNLIYCRYQT